MPGRDLGEQMRRCRIMVVLAGAVAAGGAVLLAGVAGAGAALAAAGTSPVAGAWGKAAEVPGLAALNTGGRAEVLSVSCDSIGNCVGGGYFQYRRDHQQGF